MEITEIKKSDYEALRKLFLIERLITFSWLDPTEFQLDDFEKDTQGELILVARLDDIPVGFISIWEPNNFIHHLYIDQKYQNKGIGTELLKVAIEKSNLPLSLKCLENNKKAVKFYIRKGFIETEKGISEHGNYVRFELLKNIV
jgi:GNAT superfamily N-acetyltransferase